MTSTWTNTEDNPRVSTRGELGDHGPAKKQLDYTMGPRDIRSTAWYLNQVRLRTRDHFPVITRIEGRELKTKKCVKGRGRVDTRLRSREG